MARKKGGGGKLNRSEIIQARLDPKLHMAAEIMARSERRTLSSLIEKCIEQASKSYKVKRNLFHPWWSEWPDQNRDELIYSECDEVTAEQAASDIVSDHEAIRFFKFAIYFPELLNKAEEELFNIIVTTNYFWKSYPVTMYNSWYQSYTEYLRCTVFEGLIRENLIEYWDKMKSGEVTPKILNALPRGKCLNAPLRAENRAIKEIYEKTDEDDPYETVLYIDEVNKCDISPNDTFWKKNSKKLMTDKIELKQTEDGPQIVATMSLPKDEAAKKEWIEFYKNKLDELRNGD